MFELKVSLRYQGLFDTPVLVPVGMKASLGNTFYASRVAPFYDILGHKKFILRISFTPFDGASMVYFNLLGYNKEVRENCIDENERHLYSIVSSTSMNTFSLAAENCIRQIIFPPISLKM